MVWLLNIQTDKIIGVNLGTGQENIYSKFAGTVPYSDCVWIILSTRKTQML